MPPTARPVVVLSDMLWQSVFGADPQILGQQVRLDGRPYEVIGVTPPGFRGAVWPTFQSAFWVPAAMAGDFGRELTNRGFQTVGRVRGPRSLDALQARIDPLDAALAPERVPPYFFDTGEPWHVFVLPANYLRLWPEYRTPVTQVVWTLVWMTMLALGVGCTNLSTLLMARWTDRHGELTIRRALGARTIDLVRRLGADVVVLSVVGGVGAAILVVVGSRFVPSLPLGVPYVLDLVPDGRVFLVGLGIFVTTAVGLGTVPLWKMVRAPEGLDTADRAVTGRGRRAMHGLVVTQVALTLVLAFGCALLMRSASAVRDVETGFSAEHGLTATVAFSREDMADHDRQVAVVSALVERLRASPLVEAASASGTRVLRFHPTRTIVVASSPVTAPDAPVEVRLNYVTPSYFESFGLRLLRGRDFTPADRDRAPVAVVSQAMADRYWPNGTALGQALHLEDEEAPRRIVGVVENAAANDVREPAAPTLYMPLSQGPIGWVQINLRTPGGGQSAFALLRTSLRSLDPTLPLTEVSTYGELREGASRDARVLAGLSAALAGLAVALAVVGLYGLMGYVMSRRQRELGIRSAIGASPSALAGLVVRRASQLTVAGLLLGGAISLTLGAGLQSLLFGVSPRDPLILVTTAVALASATLAACWPHARRAAHVDPAGVLRSE